MLLLPPFYTDPLLQHFQQEAKYGIFPLESGTNDSDAIMGTTASL